MRTNPIAVEVMRGERVESVHAVAAVVVDAEGAVVRSAGDVDTPRYPRSAIKALLALPLVESGVAGRFGLDDQALALACASHAGEAIHVEGARTMLERAGYGPEVLVCGAHWPLARDAAHALARAGGAPTALHNNCSGKHAGLVCLAAGLGAAVEGYALHAHPAMRAATEALASLTGCACEDANRAIDGCGIPTYAIPLASLARGFARFATGAAMGDARRDAARALRRAVAAHPRLIAGEGRFDTVLTEAFGEALFVKGGAEGVWCAAIPERGLGFAVKAEDGAGRAGEAALAALLRAELGPHPVLDERAAPVLRNWSGAPVGALRVMV